MEDQEQAIFSWDDVNEAQYLEDSPFSAPKGLVKCDTLESEDHPLTPALIERYGITHVAERNEIPESDYDYTVTIYQVSVVDGQVCYTDLYTLDNATR